MEYILAILIIYFLYQFVEYTSKPSRHKRYNHSDSTSFFDYLDSTESKQDISNTPTTPSVPIVFRYVNQYMTKQEKLTYMRTQHWKDLKAKRMSIANYTCEVPGCAEQYELECHHTNYSELGDEPIEHLRIVCRNCHQQIHENLGYGRENKYPITSISTN